MILTVCQAYSSTVRTIKTWGDKKRYKQQQTNKQTTNKQTNEQTNTTNYHNSPPGRQDSFKILGLINTLLILWSVDWFLQRKKLNPSIVISPSYQQLAIVYLWQSLTCPLSFVGIDFNIIERYVYECTRFWHSAV